jgi:hypothetical protein
MVNELKRRTANSIGLRSIHPAHVECTLQTREVLWIARTSSGRASKESGARKSGRRKQSPSLHTDA